VSVRGIVLITLGVGVITLRRWLAREQLAYIRRHYRDSSFHRAYLELFEDERSAVFVLLMAGVCIVVIGLLVLASGL
jgi:hypothetical protein